MNNLYQQPYPQRYLQPTNNSITWVQGIEGAKAYQLMPNSNMILMDSENDGRFYIKVSDNVGMCKLRIFQYEEITDEPTPQVDLSQYVTKSELTNILQSMLGGQEDEQSVPTTKRKPKALITE